MYILYTFRPTRFVKYILYTFRVTSFVKYILDRFPLSSFIKYILYTLPLYLFLAINKNQSEWKATTYKMFEGLKTEEVLRMAGGKRSAKAFPRCALVTKEHLQSTHVETIIKYKGALIADFFWNIVFYRANTCLLFLNSAEARNVFVLFSNNVGPVFY